MLNAQRLAVSSCKRVLLLPARCSLLSLREAWKCSQPLGPIDLPQVPPQMPICPVEMAASSIKACEFPFINRHLPIVCQPHICSRPCLDLAGDGQAGIPSPPPTSRAPGSGSHQVHCKHHGCPPTKGQPGFHFLLSLPPSLFLGLFWGEGEGLFS